MKYTHTNNDNGDFIDIETYDKARIVSSMRGYKIRFYHRYRSELDVTYDGFKDYEEALKALEEMQENGGD